MDKEEIEKRLAGILPETKNAGCLVDDDRQSVIAAGASRIKAKMNASELAKIRRKERAKLLALEKAKNAKDAAAKAVGLEDVPEGQTILQAERIAEQKKKVEEIEAIEAQITGPLRPSDIAETAGGLSPNSILNMMRHQGTARQDVLKLLASLNINLNLQLTKSDTANLLACLLTCNESQLNAIYRNKKVPLAIKTVVKRLQADAETGDIETVEKLWDRIFGKNTMLLNLPEPAQLEKGIIPNTPVSREAYIVIRDTLLK